MKKYTTKITKKTRRTIFESSKADTQRYNNQCNKNIDQESEKMRIGQGNNK